MDQPAYGLFWQGKFFMSNVIKKKLAPKDFNPKAILGMPVATRNLVLGTLLGMANDVTRTQTPTGDVLEGLVGKFMFKPADKTFAMAAYTLWLPAGMGNDLFALPRQGEAIEFAFEIGVTRAENPAGYEWTMRPLVEPSQADPLAALAKRAGVGEPELPQAVIETAKPVEVDSTGKPTEKHAKHKA
jgi:hypothetical protein